MAPSSILCAKCKGEVFGKQGKVCCSTCNNKSHANCYNVAPADVLAFNETYVCEVCRLKCNAGTPIAIDAPTATCGTANTRRRMSTGDINSSLPTNILSALNDFFAGRRVAQWLEHSPCTSVVPGSILGLACAKEFF